MRIPRKSPPQNNLVHSQPWRKKGQTSRTLARADRLNSRSTHPHFLQKTKTPNGGNRTSGSHAYCLRRSSLPTSWSSPWGIRSRPSLTLSNQFVISSRAWVELSLTCERSACTLASGWRAKVALGIFYVRVDHNYRYVKLPHRFSINGINLISPSKNGWLQSGYHSPRSRVIRAPFRTSEPQPTWDRCEGGRSYPRPFTHRSIIPKRIGLLTLGGIVNSGVCAGTSSQRGNPYTNSKLVAEHIHARTSGNTRDHLPLERHSVWMSPTLRGIAKRHLQFPPRLPPLVRGRFSHSGALELLGQHVEKVETTA